MDVCYNGCEVVDSRPVENISYKNRYLVFVRFYMCVVCYRAINNPRWMKNDI